MICARCSSERLFMFEAGSRIRKDAPVILPVICRDCGQIMVDGIAVSVPSGFSAATRSLKQTAARVGADVRKQLEKDPDLRVEKYFAKVYETAYLEGFMRATAYHQHHAKEGRLVRLRELWEDVHVVASSREFCEEGEPAEEHWGRHHKKYIAGSTRLTLQASEPVYTEFSKLLQLGDRHGTSSADKHQTKQESPAHVS